MMPYGGYVLIDFTVENFRSIKAPQTLSMLATKINDHAKNFYQSKEKNIRILRSAVICGANASGKSNLLLSLSTFINFILNSTHLRVEDKIPYYQPFRLDETYKTKPTSFEIEFTDNDDVRHKYAVKFNRESILSESLVFYPKGKEANLFTREGDNPIVYGDLLKGDKKIIEKQLLKNNLYFTKAANSNNEQLKLLYINNFAPTAELNEIFENARTSLASILTSYFLTKQNKTLADNVHKLILSADTGIESIEFQKSEHIEDEYLKKIIEDEELKITIGKLSNDFIDVLCQKPRIMHNLYNEEKLVDKTSFDLDDESAGTQKLYNIAGVIIKALETGSICILDELTNYLHPHVMNSLIKIFNDPQKNSNNAQLIFATHNVAIIKRDNFRRDQIWFTEKDKFGATQLYSMSEFDYRKVRKDIPFDKWYMNGRFGAVPTIKSF